MTNIEDEFNRIFARDLEDYLIKDYCVTYPVFHFGQGGKRWDDSD